MASSFLKLTYPVYTAAFDPYNNDFLFVGGGGGEGRSGIPNKITLLDTSSKDELKEVAHGDLSRDEDSVQSLAVAQSTDSTATLYAGINSSLADQKAGKNEHLRAVAAFYPPRRDPAATSTFVVRQFEALSKAAFFTQTKSASPETYQKVLRLSPPRADIKTRLGAIATRDAPTGEIILFDGSKQKPTSSDVLYRIPLGTGEEAGDIDIIETKDDGYLVTYCTAANIQVIRIDPQGKLTDTQVFEGSKRDGSFRSLRFLDRNHIFLVRNAPRKTGAQFLILQVPKVLEKGRVVHARALHKGFNAALASDVARLPALEGQNTRHYVAAIAGQDGSLALFTIKQNPKEQRQMTVEQHSILKDLHPAGITSLAFSQFKEPFSGTVTKPMRLKLASTSFANTVVVHTFALKAEPNPRQTTSVALATPPQRTARDSVRSFTTGAILVAFIALIIQAISELQGNARSEILYVRRWAPLEIKYLFDIPADPRDMGVPPHMWSKHPAIATNMPPVEPEAIARAQSIADRLSASSKAARESAAQATASAGDAISEAIASMQGAASDIPSAEDVKEQLNEAASRIPSIEEITQHVAAVAPTDVQKAAQKVMGVPTEAEKQRKQAFKKISNILRAHREKDDQASDVKAPGAVMFKDSKHGVAVSTHEHEDHLEGSGAKKWEDLSPEERHIWRNRLTDAGHWAEGETEKIFKGMFFGTLAGIVGQAVAM